jgi:hypothetical protein
MVWHAIEVRGYMAEVCLVYLMTYAALKIMMAIDEGRPVDDRGKWAVLSLAMIAGLSFRFSFVIMCAAMYGVLWFGILLKAKSPHFKKHLIWLAVSSVVSLLFFVLFFGARFYFGVSDPLNSVSPDFGAYAIPGTFLNKMTYFAKQIAHVPGALFAGPGAFPGCFYFIIRALLLMGFLVIVYRIVYYLFRVGGAVRMKTEDTLLYCGLFLFPAMAIMLTMLLAFLGLHPFSVGNRWSLYLFPSFHLFIIGMIKMAAYKDENSPRKGCLITNKSYRIGLVFIVLPVVLIYGVFYLSYKVTFRMGGGQCTRSVICNVIPEGELKDVDYWYVSVGEADSFKYHVLYGNLKDKLSPKAEIVIESWAPGSRGVRCGELEGIYKKAKEGSKVVMVMGHVDQEESLVYKDTFFRYFKDVKCGNHEISNEQVCYGVR